MCTAIADRGLVQTDAALSPEQALGRRRRFRPDGSCMQWHGPARLGGPSRGLMRRICKPEGSPWRCCKPPKSLRFGGVDKRRGSAPHRHGSRPIHMHDRENDLAARLQVRFAIDYPTIRVSWRAFAAVLRMFPCGGAERASFLAFGRAAGIAAHVPGGDRRQKPSAEKQNKSEANFAVARCVRLNVPVLAVPG